MRPTIVDNDHQINLWLLSWAFLIRSPSRIWAVSESSLFDFGSIFEPFSATNHARIGQSTLFVHEDDDGLLLSPEENTIAEHTHVHSRRKWTDDERMVYWCLPRRTPLLSMHARACISAITPNTCSTAQLPPPPQPTPPSPRPSPPAPRPLSPPPPWVARRPIASFIRFFWGPSFVKNETAAISWNETAAILNMAFSRKMNPESGYRGCLVIPVVVPLGTCYIWHPVPGA